MKLAISKDKIDRLETELNKLDQVTVDLEHYLSGGMYARHGMIPAGTTFTGAVHKKDHLNVLYGDVTMILDDGPFRYTGYHVLTCKAGLKRVAFAHADTFWTTIEKTDLTDVSEIEDELVENSEALQTRKLGITHSKTLEIESCS